MASGSGDIFSKSCDLKIMYFNSNSILGKIDTIRAHAEVYKPNIVCITETKIDYKFDDNELLGPDFTISRKDRKQGAGGVLIAVHNKSQLQIIKTEEGPGESVIVTVKAHFHSTINLITFYRPPNENSLENISSVVNNYCTEFPVIFLGDFNLPDIDWCNVKGIGSVRPTSRRPMFYQEAVDMFKSADLFQMIHSPTHIKGNTLDLVLIDSALKNEMDIKCEVVPGISDHDMILVSGKLFNKAPPKLNNNTKGKLNFKRVDYLDLWEDFYDLRNRLTENIHWSSDEMWIDFKNTIERTTAENMTTLIPRPKGKSWMTRDILRLIRLRKRVFERARKYPTIMNINTEKEISKLVKLEIKKAKKDFLHSHVSEELRDGNSKPLFNLINRSRGQANQISNLEGCSADRIADRLAEHFASVYSLHSPPVFPDFEPVITEQMNDFEVIGDGIQNLINQLDKRKSPGPDGISAYLLKEFSVNIPTFIPCITMIFNKSLKTHSIPKDWKTASICPIFKSGDRSLASNYRPISLTAIASKIIEHIIVSSMWKHIEKNNILSGVQHGFRPGFGTTTQLLHVAHKASQALDTKMEYHMVSFDFAKAFDKVPHKLLVYKLQKYRFSNQIVLWVEEWLRDRTSVVSVNGMTSAEFGVVSGVPQGSVLGPLLFLLYINDLPDVLKNCECRLYADDTLVGMNLSQFDHAELQNNVSALERWASDWGMLFNTKKCIHMQLGRPLPHFDLFLNGICIPKASVIKYLGVHFHYTLKWSEQVNYVCKKANKTLGMLRRCLNMASSKTSMLAFNSVVRPILEYASQVWSPNTKVLVDELEKIQRRAVRWAFRIPKFNNVTEFKYNSVTEKMNSNDISTLCSRREKLDLNFIERVQLGDYQIKLSDYILVNEAHNTRGKTINPHFNTNQFKFSYFNRMRTKVKVLV